MLHYFESKLDPFPATEATQPPRTLFAFCRHYTQGAWKPIIVMALISSFIATLASGPISQGASSEPPDPPNTERRSRSLAGCSDTEHLDPSAVVGGARIESIKGERPRYFLWRHAGGKAAAFEHFRFHRAGQQRHGGNSRV